MFFATMHGGAYDAEGHGYIGHFLVMPTAVPEPSPFVLLSVSLLLLGRRLAIRSSSED
jgi:hypothetical protein